MSGDPLGEVASWPAPAAAGVTDANATLAVAGDADQPEKWASVTKLLTALAALLAGEEQIVTLDDPAGPPGSTVRHLLAHASGLPYEGDRPIAAPGARRIYSNTGFEVVGEVVGAAAGMPFEAYVDSGILEPLGMAGTTVAGSAASGAVGPLADLLALGRELLAPTLLDPATMAGASEVAYPGLAGVLPGYGRQDPNDWGLGFELKDGKSPHWTGAANSPATFGHYGRSGAFLWVDPEAGLACAGLAGADAGDWSSRSWPRLADAVVDAFAKR